MQEGHCLLIEADRDLPVNAAKTPLGDLAPVADTEFDLGRLRTVLGPSNGELDHFCLRDPGPRMYCACLLEGGVALQ